jgi:ABC-type glutathione transport system ATPase component
MDEVTGCDKVIVMDNGKVVMQGTPREIFSRPEEVKSHGLDLPQVTELAYKLRESGVDMPEGVLSVEEFADAFTAACSKK